MYKEKSDTTNVQLPLEQYGHGFKILKCHGYDGTIGLGAHAQGILEPILPTKNPENWGLGYTGSTRQRKIPRPDSPTIQSLTTRGN